RTPSRCTRPPERWTRRGPRPCLTCSASLRQRSKLPTSICRRPTPTSSSRRGARTELWDRRHQRGQSFRSRDATGRHVVAGTLSPPQLCGRTTVNILSLQSHVVYGHVGNSAAVFALQRLGAEVWPLHTVQFSNHTAYPTSRGHAFDAAHIRELTQGLDE